MTDLYCVEIRSFDAKDGEPPVERFGPMHERRAERVDGGLNINLNHEEFYTLIVPADKPE